MPQPPRSLAREAVLAALLVVPLLSACGGTEPASPEPRCPRCNIVLVTFDTLRADRLGPWGFQADASPRLDSFAREAFVFSRALSQSGSTVTSLPSLMTSKFSFVDDIYEPIGLKQGERTLAHVLADAGYSTGGVIGWRYAGVIAGLDQGFQLFDDRARWAEKARRTRRRAVAMLQQLEPPFFLWVHMRQPHHPYRVRDASFDEFYPNPDSAPTLQDDSWEEVFLHFGNTERVDVYEVLGKKDVPLTATMLEQLRAQYLANLKEGDEEFGELMRYLDESGLAARSVVAIAADHGESLGERNVFGHNNLFYGVLHTPIMIRVPERRHEVLDHPVMNVDLYPTLLGIVGVPVPGSLRGRDLFEADRGDGYFQFAEYEDLRSVVVGDHQLILGLAGGRLFDLSADPLLARDLSASEPRTAALLSELARSIPSLGSDEARPLSERSETFEALRALGYLE